MGIQAIADLLGVTRGRAYQLSREKGFPDPLPERRAGYGSRKMYDEKAVRKWARDHGREVAD